MSQTLNNVLIIKNTHNRDQNIEFFENGHKYFIS